VSPAHRSIDGTSLHPGFIENCSQCAPPPQPDKHSPNDHHGFYPPDFYGPEASEFCICGSRENTAIHEAPYCQDCEPDPINFDAPQRWWSRLYSRLVARFGKRY